MFTDTFSTISNTENYIVQEEKGEQAPLTSAYTIVSPINISSASDWASYGFITGNGSENNPYVIENVEIQGTGVKTSEEYGPGHLNYKDFGIYINAAGNCTIRNCRISSISYGIYRSMYHIFTIKVFRVIIYPLFPTKIPSYTYTRFLE